jgi:Arrestin (or S-antigen), N-terminal domain
VRIRLFGETRCDVQSGKDTMHRRVEFLSMRRTLQGVLRSERSKYNASIMPVGVYRFPVWFPPLPDTLPPNLKHNNSQVKYSVRAYLDRPRRTDSQTIR